MSIKVHLSEIQQSELAELLHIKKESSKYVSCRNEEFIYPYRITEEDIIYLPFGFASKYLNTDKRPLRNIFYKSEFKFDHVKLRENQEIVKTEAMEYLNKNGSVMISTYTGFGKTITAIKLASIIKLPTMVITKGKTLIDQWRNDLELFSSDCKCQILTTSTKIKPNLNFYIVNAINVEKLDLTFLESIGLVIIDEAHLIMSDILSRSLLYLTPRYVIGLTATPYRYDSYNKLLELFFGFDTDKTKFENKDNPIIFRKMNRGHTVYKVETGFKPEVNFSANGKVNWGDILDQQSKNTDRNEFIIRIVKKFKDNVFIILCKRVSHAEYLYKRLLEENESCTILTGDNDDFDKKCRVLVAMTQKAGTGFNHPKLNSLILATDALNYYIQFLGRVFRTLDVIPTIFDIVDTNPILKKHFDERRKVYEEHGGIVKSLKI